MPTLPVAFAPGLASIPSDVSDRNRDEAVRGKSLANLTPEVAFATRAKATLEDRGCQTVHAFEHTRNVRVRHPGNPVARMLKGCAVTRFFSRESLFVPVCTPTVATGRAMLMAAPITHL
ncbi:MAG: hypothetical protein ACF8CQ_06600 [Rhodopirellula sp. JB044]|uniref:hypothetical protein n=1 Tax=Rhodopirellula sp. JB044 TaxID=3342844 RepID=UPI00370A2B60